MAAEKTVKRRVGAPMLSAVAALVAAFGVSAMSSAAKADDDTSRFTYVRLHCTPDNQSHFSNVTIELAKENFAPPAAPIAIGGNKQTSRAFIAGFGAHWGAADLEKHLNHPTPAIQLFTVLRGEFSITVTDGETRKLHAGDLVQLEDNTPCKGHITVVGDQPGFLLFAR
jgi:Cupin domain